MPVAREDVLSLPPLGSTKPDPRVGETVQSPIFVRVRLYVSQPHYPLRQFKVNESVRQAIYIIETDGMKWLAQYLLGSRLVSAGQTS